MIDILRRRRSIRRYEKKSIAAPLLETLKEAPLRCPSSRGTNPWTFIFVDDRALLEHLSRAKAHGASFLKGAALGVVVCGDELQSDVWVEDCSIASIVVQLAAESVGLGSCSVQIRKRQHSAEKTAEEYVQEALDIPANLKVLSIISIGYAGEAKRPIPADQLDYNKIRFNKF